MCGRFALSNNPEEIINEFEIRGGFPKEPILPANWNITPTQDIYVVTAQENGIRELAIKSWGIIAPWSKDSASAVRSQSQAINARSETVHEKPTFRNAFRNSRCLIPASGYFEWATELGKYKTKQPIYISREDGALLLFAGIYDKWITPDGQIKESAAIITRDATGGLSTIHHRMPVFLPKDRWSSWLDPAITSTLQVRDLMQQQEPARGLRFWPVADLVNSTRNNGHELISPIELGEPEVLF